MVIRTTLRQKYKAHFAFLYGLQINKFYLMSHPKAVRLAALVTNIYERLDGFYWWPSILYEAVFWYSGT
jgi:hypothetical protein